MATIHDHLVSALDPRPSDRWLDVATGTGAVATRAALAGANVTGVDIAPQMIETARREADAAGLSIEFDVADAQALPYADASFDVVSSAHGVIFAPDHRAAASELARVCRPGARLGVTAWRTGEAGDEFDEILARFAPAPARPEPRPRPPSWGNEAHARELLGGAFELRFLNDVWIQEGNSGEAIWQLLTTSSPPFKTLADDLDRHRHQQLHAAWVKFYERHRTPNGIRVPHGYVLIVGRRNHQ
jgi:SAM-dependent methyltransferase